MSYRLGFLVANVFYKRLTFRLRTCYKDMLLLQCNTKTFQHIILFKYFPFTHFAILSKHGGVFIIFKVHIINVLHTSQNNSVSNMGVSNGVVSNGVG